MIYFAERYAIETSFLLWCKSNGLKSCVLNFLSWCQTTDEGKKVVKRLCEETKILGNISQEF